MEAALVLFDEQGYDETTVADIAARAGLTRRTFFRYFPDKREVLFRGAGNLETVFVEAVTRAPLDASPIVAIRAGLAGACSLFDGLHPIVRIRARVVAANPELQERELIKLEHLSAAIASALEARSVDPSLAVLASDLGVRVFRLSFAEWVVQDDPAGLGAIIEKVFGDLKVLLAD